MKKKKYLEELIKKYDDAGKNMMMQEKRIKI